MNNWTRMNFQPCIPLGEDGRCITSCDAHISLSHRAAAEGMVLLKNDGLLPLNTGAKVAVFAKAQYDYIKGGGGSGDVYCKYIRDIYQGFKVKADEGKISLYEGLYPYYKDEMDKQYAEGVKKGQTTEPVLPENLLNEAEREADIAVIAICRFSGEHFDRAGEKCDFYLSDEEEAMVKAVCNKFDKVVAILNVGGMVDSAWFSENNKIGASLLAWNAGMEGGLAIADIVCGDVNPSGKLPDTFAKTFDDYPSSANFNESEAYIKYYDDIYVGYRYFETIPGASNAVNYPFGFGLSYTTFDIGDVSVNVIDDTICVSCSVTNTGDVAGREVVQVYTSAPVGKLGKPARELKGFSKTRILNPNEKQEIKITFNVSDMASYDDLGVYAKAAYILEKGEYSVYIGNSVRDAKKADFAYSVEDEFVMVEQLKARVVPLELEKRLKCDGTYEELPLNQYKTFDYDVPKEVEVEAPNEKAVFEDVVKGNVTLDEFMAQLNEEELISLITPKPNTGVSNVGGIGIGRDYRVIKPKGVRDFEIPCAATADGPAGIRIMPETCISTTAWPCATLLASTWDTELMTQVGECAAKEAKENNLFLWLAPALNIHRSPLCGRNFEYFSEDPVLSGKMAAAEVKGIQKQKVAACIKHFACNNKEVNRYHSDSVVSERALREIYIKGFEICIKEADPWMLMTSYNKLNGWHTSENYELITEILRGEWGFNGLVISDWGAWSLQYLEIKAGNDVKMPIAYIRSINEHLGALEKSEVYASAKRVLEMLIKLY